MQYSIFISMIILANFKAVRWRGLQLPGACLHRLCHGSEKNPYGMEVPCEAVCHIQQYGEGIEEEMALESGYLIRSSSKNRRTANVD